jgi:hypothetical protein
MLWATRGDIKEEKEKMPGDRGVALAGPGIFNDLILESYERWERMEMPLKTKPFCQQKSKDSELENHLLLISVSK